ncbi:hypothetical protein [Marinitoga lauensis]|uniref:hypothetical protein n=1 Tax=Marinitoga lauensis TaxID=2201189 RepID=UPI0010104FC0|nr:hypothetical protein [Marinitoga lauensis]
MAEARKNFKPLYRYLEELVEEKKIDENILNQKIEKINKLQKEYYNKNYTGKILMDISKKALK